MKEEKNIKIPVLSELYSKGNKPEYLLWIGCAGSFDERYKKVIHSLVRVLNIAKVDFAVLGPEETCTGDPARRAGNEFLFQMMALTNIQLLNGYEVKKIITACPHCYNTLKNEYPDLGGVYEVIHHTELLESLLKSSSLMHPVPKAENIKVTYHDSCYLGRSNNIYDSPRELIKSTYAEIVEMDRSREEGLCCGAGGSQMFKDSEEGNRDINIERAEEALNSEATTVVTACPFCLTMISDGMKALEKENEIEVVDVVELFERSAKNQ